MCKELLVKSKKMEHISMDHFVQPVVTPEQSLVIAIIRRAVLDCLLPAGNKRNRIRARIAEKKEAQEFIFSGEAAELLAFAGLENGYVLNEIQKRLKHE